MGPGRLKPMLMVVDDKQIRLDRLHPRSGSGSVAEKNRVAETRQLGHQLLRTLLHPRPIEGRRINDDAHRMFLLRKIDNKL
ncbi:hypothetical protein D3C85_1681420 [compost metagenome]